MTDRRLVLIRHGRVDFESREFWETPRGRQWNPPLGEVGRDQANRLRAGLMPMERPSALYCSPFSRCVETAAPFAEAAGCEPTYEADIGEVFVGDWEGESFEQILSSDEEAARRFHAREPLWTLAPGGEEGSAFRTRVVAAVERMLLDHRDGDVFVVAHGGVINAYVMHVLGIADRDMFFLPENTSLNIVDIEGDQRRIRFINDTRHLSDLGMFRDGPAPAR